MTNIADTVSAISLNHRPSLLNFGCGLIKNTYDDSVIMSNYFDNGIPYVSMAVTDDGVPSVHYYGFDDDVKKADIDLYFNDINLYTSSWTHVTFVFNGEDGNVYLYVDGQLQDFLPFSPVKSPLTDYNFFVGGDNATANRKAFLGKIKSVAVFGECRTENEIFSDMEGVKLKNKNLLAYYDLSLSINDGYVAGESGNGNVLKKETMFFTEKEPVEDYAYTFAFVGDTQILASDHGKSFLKVYDWIIENKDSKKMEFVFGLGDITDKDSDREWKLAKEGIGKLSQIVPYTVVRGNHDSSENFNKILGTEDYIADIEGFYEEGKIDNVWRTFRVGGTDYLFLCLDYKPENEIVDWAAKVVEEHPDHKVIITTHAFLRPRGKINNDTVYLEEALVLKYPNVLLVCSGHHPCDDVILTQNAGKNGNNVTYVLLDTQDTDKEYPNGVGTVALFYFSEDRDTVDIEYYSAAQDAYFKENNQLEFSLTGNQLVENDQQELSSVWEYIAVVAVAVLVCAAVTVVMIRRNRGKKK